MSVQEPQIQDSSYRGWLALVIILGVLILVMVGALIAGMFLRTGGASSGTPYLATLVAAGGHIESTQLDGNRILVRLSGGAGGEELVVLDAGTGRVIGRIAVAPQP